MTDLEKIVEGFAKLEKAVASSEGRIKAQMTGLRSTVLEAVGNLSARLDAHSSLLRIHDYEIRTGSGSGRAQSDLLGDL